ncbi:MAG TPA: hypothetical protein VMT12_15800 [Syntrophales bacterium]|nr:hypothetical protein [Syntrophales bacterium]
MKLTRPDGTESEGTISKARNKVVTIFLVSGTGAKAKQELTKITHYELRECEILEATDEERKLLKEGNFKSKGL